MVLTGGSYWLTKKAKCGSFWINWDIYNLFFVLWLPESELLGPGGEFNLNSKASSRGAAKDHLLYRLSVLQTFFKLPCHVAYCWTRYVLQIPKQFRYRKSDIPSSRNRKKTLKKSRKIWEFFSGPKALKWPRISAE